MADTKSTAQTTDQTHNTSNNSTTEQSTPQTSDSTIEQSKKELNKEPGETSEEKAKGKVYNIAGRSMTAADIFKFVGLLAFFAVMIVICVLLWPYIAELFEPGGYQNVINSVRNAGPVGVVILLVIQFIQIVVAFIPGEVVQIAAGLIYGPWIGALIVLAGAVISSAFIFVLVHRLGAPFVQAMVSDKYMDKFRSFEKSGRLNIVVFILFLIPGLPKDIFTYITPLTHMPMRTFLLLTNIARIPGIVLSTYAAAGLVEGHIAESIILFVVVAAIAVAALLSYERIMRYFEKRFGREGLNLNAIDTSTEKSVKSVKSEKPAKPEKSVKPAKSGKSEKSEKTTKKSSSKASHTEPSA